MDEILERARKVAIDSAREAGSILRGGFATGFWVKAKSPGDLVTELDLRAEEAILRKIRDEFPDHGILAEESGQGDSDSEYMWIVDPLDGTTNYSIHNPFFCTSVSLAFRKETVLGVTLAPMTGEVFHAQKGKGAWLEPMRGGEPARLNVSPEPDISRLLLSFCNGKEPGDREEIGRIFQALKPLAGDFDRYKAGALELAFTAAGRFGGYLANSQMSWDSSAGALLVREAGGKVTDFLGREWDIESRDILATNGLVHDRVLEIIKEIRNSQNDSRDPLTAA